MFGCKKENISMNSAYKGNYAINLYFLARPVFSIWAAAYWKYNREF
jgi:hypothetical protein